ncbi:MAG TPA: acyltransferase [Candidatus Cryptobacteroides intestinipullorum]|nr:acyltransferase [Candidatus Cryptobacteroides intestinipullorum]
MARKQIYLASKPRYEILDGLRGVASVIVVIFHIFESYSAGPAYQFINHGYLAVDFFFVLSGFVIGYAYDDRWGKMGTWGFFKRRLVRLHPMVVFGTVVGICFYYLGQCGLFPLIGNIPAWKVILAFVMGCLMIPCGPRMDIRGWGEFNTFNGPNWSLTWEYLGNILYAFIFRRLPNIILGILVAAAGFLTLDLCLNLNVFGLLTEARNSQMYTPIGGWSLTSEQVYIGLTRLFYPFLAGLLLSRIGKRIRIQGGFWWCSVILAVVLSIPCVGGEGSILNGIYNAFCIIVIFPLIVMIGAGSVINGAKGNRICDFLGQISYPLYITHYPLMYVQMCWVYSHPDAPLFAHLTMNIGVVVLSVFIAWAALKLYDIPLRAWLKDRLWQ